MRRSIFPIIIALLVAGVIGCSDAGTNGKQSDETGINTTIAVVTEISDNNSAFGEYGGHPSPDGKYFYFISARDGNSKTYQINIEALNLE